MDIRQTVTLVEEIRSEYGAHANPPLRRVAIAAVLKNPLVGKAAGTDIAPLVDYSLDLGVTLTKSALARRNCGPMPRQRWWGRVGDLEHGAAMIHPRLGMAMRRTIKRGRLIIPGHAKVGPPGTAVDLLYGPVDEGWDLDAHRFHTCADPRCTAVGRDSFFGSGTPPAHASTPGARGPIRKRSMS